MKRRVNRRRRIINKPRGNNRYGRRGAKSQVNISSFIEATKKHQLEHDVQELVVDRTFSDFQLHEQLMANIQRLGFTSPTPIQDRSFDLIHAQKDVLGIANTGTGKTGAFLIPALNTMLTNPGKKMLVLAPTRELAMQINELFMQLAFDIDIYSVQCIGGTNMHRQMRSLERRFEVLVGTPGRVLDLSKRKALDLSIFNIVVLDEVDRMLDMGFIRDIRSILGKTQKKKQSLYFSATTTNPVVRLITELSPKIESVSVKTAKVATTVEHDIVRYQQTSKKVDMLHDILIREDVEKTLIFGRTKRGVNRLMRELKDRGFRADAIHGNKSQAARQRALKAFRDDKITILVATDVAARGLDIDNVSHVINFEAPESLEDYIHRAGRTGRAGNRGVAYTFVQ